MAEASIESLRTELALCLAAKPKRDRVPDGFDVSLKSACDNNNNERRLLTYSLPTFLAFVSISNANPGRKDTLNSLCPEALDALVHTLSSVHPHEELAKLARNAFHHRKRGSTRRSLLKSAKLDSVIPTESSTESSTEFSTESPQSPRPNKRPRLEQQQQRPGFSDSVGTAGARPLFASPPVASLPPVNSNLLPANSIIMQPQDSSHFEQPNASILVSDMGASGQSGVYENTQIWSHRQDSRGLSKAQHLSSIFRGRSIDDIVVTTDHLACLEFIYRPPPETCILCIKVHRDAALRLASELYHHSIEYNERRGKWVMKLTSGVDVYCREWLLEGAQSEAVEAYFGSAVYNQLRASSLSIEEKLRGKLLTKIVTLEARTDDSYGLLKLFMDAEQLTFFESFLSFSSS